MFFFEKIHNFLILKIMSVYGGHCRRKYIHQSKKSDEISNNLLLEILKKNKNTEFGKKYSFSDIKSVKEYQDKIPFTLYNDYEDYLQRTADNGEQNLITADKINFFANTSGTTGITKRIPVVEKSYKPFVDCASIFIWILNQQLKKNGIILGKGLNTIETEYSITKAGIRQGFISAYALESAKMIIPAITCLPKDIFGYGDSIDMKYIKARYALQDKNLIYIMSVFMSTLTDLMKYISDNQKMLISDIQSGTINKSVNIPDDLRIKLEKKLKPNLERAQELKLIFDTVSDEPLIPRIWPKMSMVIAIGTGEFSPFTEKMRSYCGDKVKFCYEMYAASEALVASSINAEDKNYLLIPDGGFFEFLPVDEEYSRPLLLNELEAGKQYEIVVTNLSGLYRYRIKDVIRVMGYMGKTPLIQFSYRKEQLINITGVKLTIEHITNAIENFEKQTQVRVADYSLYADTDFTPWRVVAFMELDGEIPAEKEKNIREIFDEEITNVNHEYGRMLKIGECSPSKICIVNKNTYRNYRNMKVKKGASDNQVKTIRFIDSSEKLDFFKKSVVKIYD